MPVQVKTCAGFTVILNCSLDSNPPVVQVRWSKNDKVLDLVNTGDHVIMQ